MSYFGEGERREGAPEIARGIELRRFTVAPGVHLAPVIGDRLNVNVVTLEGGAVADVHVHDEEQIGFVVKGACEFTDGSETWLLEPGDLYRVAPGVPHGARALGEGCVIVDAFAPVRAAVRELLEG